MICLPDTGVEYIRQKVNSQFSTVMCWKHKKKEKNKRLWTSHKDLSDFDIGQIVMARRSSQRMYKMAGLVRSSQHALVIA